MQRHLWVEMFRRMVPIFERDCPGFKKFVASCAPSDDSFVDEIADEIAEELEDGEFLTAHHMIMLWLWVPFSLCVSISDDFSN